MSVVIIPKITYSDKPSKIKRTKQKKFPNIMKDSKKSLREIEVRRLRQRTIATPTKAKRLQRDFEDMERKLKKKGSKSKQTTLF